jgi:hypothetical protein
LFDLLGSKGSSVKKSDTVGFASKWSDKHTAAFESLKATLCSAPVLVNPVLGDPDCPFVVISDASDVAVGGLLLQGQGKVYNLLPSNQQETQCSTTKLWHS